MIALLGLAGALAIAVPQIPSIPKVKIPTIPGLDRLMKEDPPITTSLGDALTEIPYLDGFNPRNAVPMTVLPRNADGTFKAFPGQFSFEAQSYCLHAGTHGPGSGEGYLYAPLKGPKQGVIRGILQRSTAHPEIAQQEVQRLVWAILARTKPSELKGDIRQTADQLLTDKDRSALEGSGMDFLKENSTGSPFMSLPGPLRQVMEAENQMRNMFYSPSAPFAELERVAVLSGEYQPRKGDRPVPRGRWSWHPDGYFARYYPDGYSFTTQNIYFREEFDVEIDKNGVASLIKDPAGRQLQVVGGEAIYSEKGAEVGRAKFSPSKPEGDKRKSDFDKLIKKFRKGASAKELAAIADVASAFDSPQETWQHDARELAIHAWMSTLSDEAQGKEASLFAMVGMSVAAANAYDPTNTVATPGETGRQRLAQSSRCKHDSSPDEGDTSEGGELKKSVIDGMKARGYDIGPDNVYIYDQRSTGGMLRFVVRMGHKNNPLPTGECINEQIAGGQVPPGSLEGAKELFFGSVQFSGTMKRVGVRTVDVETGVVTGAGKGDSTGIHPATGNAFQNYQRW
ncbi:MAG: hypothetical protein H7Y17_00705 [Chlorobia bacterium]|nr:hypothetical protein [Fimbriimonadaceae bacterium]